MEHYEGKGERSDIGEVLHLSVCVCVGMGSGYKLSAVVLNTTILGDTLYDVTKSTMTH